MGLKSQLKEDEDESFFQSEGYNESQSFGLATSNMSSAVKVSGGFGPPNKNGYGVCYQIRKNKVEFCVSGSRSGTTNVKEFIQQIERIMTDLIGLFPSR